MRDYMGATYYDCDHLSDREMHRIHNLPVQHKHCNECGLKLSAKWIDGRVRWWCSECLKDSVVIYKNT